MASQPPTLESDDSPLLFSILLQLCPKIILQRMSLLESSCCWFPFKNLALCLVHQQRFAGSNITSVALPSMEQLFGISCYIISHLNQIYTLYLFAREFCFWWHCWSSSSINPSAKMARESFSFSWSDKNAFNFLDGLYLCHQVLTVAGRYWFLFFTAISHSHSCW